jgi:hypothetical protein
VTLETECDTIEEARSEYEENGGAGYYDLGVVTSDGANLNIPLPLLTERAARFVIFDEDVSITERFYHAREFDDIRPARLYAARESLRCRLNELAPDLRPARWWALEESKSDGS